MATIRDVPFMGVIWAVHEASKLGYFNGHPEWVNLGQGQPEVGPLAGAPPRIEQIALEPSDHAYGGLGGIDPLRDAVAAYVNRLHRDGRKPYTRDHVAVASGGRLALSRIFTALARSRVGYQTPDYTAYEDYFRAHADRITPVRVEAPEATGFLVTPEDVAATEADVFLLSNPNNPTGQALAGDALKRLVDDARGADRLLVLDEFYSHFAFTDSGPAAEAISGAAYVEDVDRDPVLIVDGLTKSFRYPGWRVGWVLGPPDIMETIQRVASALDGGPSIPAQRAGIAALEPAQADGETLAVRAEFARKRDTIVAGLRDMGIRIPAPPTSTFYVWADLSGLPEGLRDADAFFHAALKHKVMTVPGRFFDVDPLGENKGASRFRTWMRFSFGPSHDQVVDGLTRLRTLVDAHQQA